MQIKTPPSNPTYRDGWERNFGEGIPEMSKDIKEMLYEWLKEEEYTKIVLFFAGHMDYSEDRSEYLLRELMRGNV